MLRNYPELCFATQCESIGSSKSEVCGVNEGTSLLIGLQILETRRVSSYSFEHRTALSNQAESGTAATVTVIDDLSGDVASGMLSDALSNGSSISTEAAGTRSPAGEAYRL